MEDSELKTTAEVEGLGPTGSEAQPQGLGEERQRQAQEANPTQAPRERSSSAESPESYSRRFQQWPIGLVRLDRDGVILESNLAGARMLDTDRALLSSGQRPFLTQVAHDSRAAFVQHLEHALASREAVSCEVSLRDRRGAETFVRLQSVHSSAPDGSSEILVTLTDLTERHLLEQMLTQQRLRADAAVAAKELFFGMLSHELRTPLTPLVAVVEELEASPDRSAHDQSVFALIRRNLELEARLIDDVLDLARITDGKLELYRQVIDLHVCLQRAIEKCRTDITAKRLEVDLDLTATRHFVDADPNRLRQVFWNLIKNAVSFTAAEGKISIATRCDEASQIIVEFCDTGIEVDWWPLGRIFDPMFEIPLSLKQRVGGLGLGLAICKAIAEAHGGALTAASSGSDKGATFRFEMPTVGAPAESSPLKRVREHRPVARREGLRLLLVEDHDDTREVIERLLRRRGYEVHAASDAAAARALCEERTFDLLVSDVGLPDVSGCELLKELDAKYGLQGIAMSGFAADADIALSKNAGFLEHLVKPVDPKALDAAIQRLATRKTHAASPRPRSVKETRSVET